MAPEVLEGYYDAMKSDVHSLGTLLYIMVFFEYPFRSSQIHRTKLYTVDNYLESKIKRRNRAYLLTKNAFQVLKTVWRFEKDRPTSKQLSSFPFFNC